MVWSVELDKLLQIIWLLFDKDLAYWLNVEVEIAFPVSWSCASHCSFNHRDT